MNSLLRNLAFAVLLLVPTSSAFAANGANSGGGGDAYSIQFVHLATGIAENLLDLDGREPSGVTAKALNDAIFSTRVESTSQQLKLAGREVDAINYPRERRIVFSRVRWDQMSHLEKQVLVLHEYLGILGIKDDAYQVSKTIIGAKGSTYQCKLEVRKNKDQFMAEISGTLRPEELEKISTAGWTLTLGQAWTHLYGNVVHMTVNSDDWRYYKRTETPKGSPFINLYDAIGEREQQIWADCKRVIAVP